MKELSEACRISFQEKISKISAASWYYYKKFNTMQGHMNANFIANRHYHKATQMLTLHLGQLCYNWCYMNCKQIRQ